MMKKIGIIILMLFTQSIFAADLITKVINLNNKTAAEVIALVKPLLKPGEEITGTGQTLIVNVSPDTLTQLRTVLHSIDAPPTTFQITIYQGAADWLSTQEDDSVTYTTNSNSNKQRSQSVKVMSGESAFVATGEDTPIVTSIGAGLWTGAGVNYEQYHTEKGLLVKPILSGNQVKLMVKRVRSQENSQMHGSQQFENQNVETTLMVPLNKWVALGSAEDAAINPSDSDSETISVGNRFQDSATLYIKVQKAF